MEELPSKIKLARCGGHSASASNISSNSEELTKNALMMDKLQNAVQEQVARFR
ncbi:unnamed protein product [Meloidogyne enterolobii]|uniref:Uncharacterized protein n=1 Tax=Meloidogyne enterolobii TaxID=390850 RepID=A0ACB0XWT6_MELEN